MNCLWCHKEITIDIDWTTLFLPPKTRKLCHQCERHLGTIKGSRCSKCSRLTNDKICQDCRWWERELQEDPLLFNYSLFSYNDFLQEVIAKWKYRGDYVLGEIFEPFFKEVFQKKFSHVTDVVAVPIPLSEERIKERRFNQSEMLAKYLPIPMVNAFSRIHSEKQSKKTRQQRINTKNPFIIHQEVQKKVILVDDIYTTGTTLRHAAKLLKQHGCEGIYAYTLIRG